MHNGMFHHCWPIPSQSLSSNRSALVNSSQFYCSPWCQGVWNIPLDSQDQPALAVPPPSFFVPPASSGRAVGEAGKSLTQCKHRSAAAKNQCVISIILALNPKHSTVPATGEKNNSIPARAHCKDSKSLKHSGRLWGKSPKMLGNKYMWKPNNWKKIMYFLFD